ncbi:MAG TPA: class I SAM-dependent methyltransferase [Smithellaceae bacterium]|nr:class I SAM-dependent methyltransferase [Smithellaceae bacterium]
MKKSLEAIYDEFAATYEKSRGLFDMSEILNIFYESLVLKNGCLLDLGCGAGEPSDRFFVDRGWKVTGVDFSAQMLALAKKYVPEMRTMHADMRNVEFTAGSFEAITAIYSLFHIPSRDHADLLEKFYRWLRPGGKALFTYATKEYTGSPEFDGYKEFLGEKLYYSHKSPEMLYADLEKTGFRIISRNYREIGGETFLWVTISRP